MLEHTHTYITSYEVIAGTSTKLEQTTSQNTGHYNQRGRSVYVCRFATHAHTRNKPHNFTNKLAPVVD
jgi:hypothetical protein